VFDLIEAELWVVQSGRFPQNHQSECTNNLLEFVALALVKHGLSQNNIFPQHANFLQFGQCSVQCGTEVQRLQRCKRREEWAELLWSLQ
jgi:hypothetical protein